MTDESNTKGREYIILGPFSFSHGLIIPQDPQDSFGKIKNKPDCEHTFNDYLAQKTNLLTSTVFWIM
jgi:hypothetical protein